MAEARVPKELRMNWVDYLLSAIASGLSGFTAGMGLQLPSVGWIFVAFIVAGTLLSYGLQVVLPEKVARWDSVAYAIIATLVIVYQFQLNHLLPYGGFPRLLLLAGVLSWMLALGSFALWRDVSLLFQAVPCIALFGLVGTWDTFREAPYLFFGFLLAFAAIYARAHRRQMLNYAYLSGYRKDDGDGKAFVTEMHRGPWRWMAGPEWALASASVVLIISFVTAPILQDSVKGFAGNVRVPTPPTNRATTSPGSDPFRTGTNSEVSPVGQGPADLSRAIVFTVQMDEPGYLRTRTYTRYDPRGWVLNGDFLTREQMVDAVMDPGSSFNLPKNALKEPRRLDFALRFTQPTADSLPTPGAVESISGIGNYGFRPDGTVSLYARVPGSATVRGTSLLPPENLQPANADPRALADYADPNGLDAVPEAVERLAQEVTQGATTDFEKAQRIQRAIESTARYNLSAPATPEGMDPVEHFLFTSKEGYCDLFASSMVLMARSVGLPARYATGFYARPTEMDRNNVIAVRESDSHAWAEVFFEDAGWVVFDPTSGAPQVPNAGVGDPTASEPFWERPWVMGTLATLGGLGALAGLAFGAIRLRGSFRGRWTPARRLARSYEQFVRALERASGKPKRPSQTPSEYLAGVQHLLPPLEPVSEMNAAFVRAFYDAPGHDAVDTIQGRLSETIRALRAHKRTVP